MDFSLMITFHRLVIYYVNLYSLKVFLIQFNIYVAVLR
jgi:hypothetical protein